MAQAQCLASQRAIAVAVFLATWAAGCAPYIDPRVPEPIRPYVAPEGPAEYLLYRPSSYDRNQTWPLIITCHGSFPDSANHRIRDWTQLAESYGFLVAAPKLRNTQLRWPHTTSERIDRLRKNERDVLATVRHIRASHNVSEDRIFIYGRAVGAHTALYAGLRHPEIFRAVAVTDPAFDKALVSHVADGVDPHQPVLVDHDLSDSITGDDAQRAISWLENRCLNLFTDSHGRFKAPNAQAAVDFFTAVVRRYPLIRIRAFPADENNPLDIQFRFQGSFEPARIHWEFGDDSSSTLADPIHTYPAADRYVVKLTVEDSQRRTRYRTAVLTLPELVLTPLPPESQPRNTQPEPHRTE